MYIDVGGGSARLATRQAACLKQSFNTTGIWVIRRTRLKRSVEQHSSEQNKGHGAAIGAVET